MASEQPKRQPKARRAKSPRSGAEIPCGEDHPGTWKPGQSGNPAGSSAKARAKAALEKIATSPRLESVLSRLFAIASGSGSKDADAVQAARLASQLVGLAHTEDKLEVAVTTTIAFEDRRSGSTVVVQRVKPKFEADAEVRERPSGEREIEIG